jgi:peroxiredoxin
MYLRLDRLPIQMLGFILAALVGFALGTVQFRGLDRPVGDELAESESSDYPVPTQVGANDPSGAYLLATPAQNDTMFPVAPVAGALAPDFTLETLGGQSVSLSDYRGQQVLVNFWASWCVPCREEAPQLQAAYEQYDDFVILGVNVLDTEDNAQAFAAEFGLTFPLPVDDGGSTMRTYRVRALPMSFFLDRGGVIRFVHMGPLTEATIAEYLIQMP